VSDQSSEGYRAALQMITYGGTLIWTIFRSLLATNALLLALTGAILNIYPDLKVFPILLSLLGLLVCASWILIMMRQMDYYRYWFAWARAFESQALGDFKMIREGKRYSEGESVIINGSLERMRWGSRLFKVEWLVYIVVIAIGLVHGFLLWRAWQ
jgi:hypothetical protein